MENNNSNILANINPNLIYKICLCHKMLRDKLMSMFFTTLVILNIKNK